MYDHIAILSDGGTGRCSSWDTTGRNQDRWLIGPGETRVLADIDGPGVITHLWFTQRDHYRECLLRITWDDSPHPSVVAPLGDFFCLGHGIVASFQSALFTASTAHDNRFDSGCALSCYAPMPFRRRALVDLVNESSEEHLQYFYIDYERLPEARGRRVLPRRVPAHESVRRLGARDHRQYVGIQHRQPRPHRVGEQLRHPGHARPRPLPGLQPVGDQLPRRLAGVLAGVGDADQLAQAGDWIIDCVTGEELIARFGNGSPRRS